MLRQIHDDLDAAVAEAYGWPVDLADEEILARLVALNHERAEEERRGRPLAAAGVPKPHRQKQTAIAIAEPTCGSGTRDNSRRSKPNRSRGPKNFPNKPPPSLPPWPISAPPPRPKKSPNTSAGQPGSAWSWWKNSWKLSPRSAKPGAVDEHRYIAA